MGGLGIKMTGGQEEDNLSKYKYIIMHIVDNNTYVIIIVGT